MDEAIICDFLQRVLVPVSAVRLPGRAAVPVTFIAHSGSMPLLAALTPTFVHLLCLWTGVVIHRSISHKTEKSDYKIFLHVTS